MTPELEKRAIVFLKSTGLLSRDVDLEFEPLSGGVSSEIYRFEIKGRMYCLKSALSKLNVEGDWYADVERSYYEAEWLRYAGSVLPDNVPEIIAYDQSSHFILMEYLPPEKYEVWKSCLSEGRCDADFTIQVGEELATLHAQSAVVDKYKTKFDSMNLFYQLRIEPYIIETSKKQNNEKIRRHLLSLAKSLENTKSSIIHGDVSPKNILCGPDGPVFIDAECACFGDPAFDLAFCLNHLLLKCIWKPAYLDDYIFLFLKLKSSYLDKVDWEDAKLLESRTSRLLPALLLARIDGKSPVEYINCEKDKQFIREYSREQLSSNAEQLDSIATSFCSAFENYNENNIV